MPQAQNFTGGEGILSKSRGGEDDAKAVWWGSHHFEDERRRWKERKPSSASQMPGCFECKKDFSFVIVDLTNAGSSSLVVTSTHLQRKDAALGCTFFKKTICLYLSIAFAFVLGDRQGIFED